ncbi:MAG: alanyl-tRNA editing protein [Chloroflexi bacterium]|nr:alanyl-tRNA editing protein [Chloroflexota bacterium]
MTELLYQTYAYMREFTAFVTAVTPEGGVVLDRTAFYPTGGGQPCDFGHLVTHDGRRYAITQVKKVGEEVVHVGEGDALVAGEMVTGQLDWERRYQLMRTHTAMHILCGVVWRDYKAQVTGGNMDPLQGRMDFEFETMSQELVAEIEAAVNREVEAAHPVYVRFLPREEAFQIPDLIRTKINLLPPAITEIRIVQLAVLDLQADGGTHVANTREVGRMRITDYKSKGKINKRIYVELDRDER